MSMFESCRRAGLLAALAGAFLAANPATAELIEADLVSAGDGLITQDTETGLEWLDLTETTGLSFDDVQGGVGGWLADGWRHATGDEICELVAPILVSPPADCAVLIDRYQATSTVLGTDDLMVLLGVTAPGAEPQTIGAFDDGDPTFVGGAFLRVNAAPFDPDVLIFRDQLSRDTPSVTVGQWLVREIPLPPEDLNADGAVNVVDFAIYANVFGQPCSCPEDLNGDGGVSIFDFPLLAAAFDGVLPAGGQVVPGTQATIEPPDVAAAQIGDTFETDVVFEGDLDLFAIQAGIDYDPAVLAFVGFTTPLEFAAGFPAIEGTGHVVVSALGFMPVSLTGSTVIATAEFEVLSPQQTALSLSDVAWSDTSEALLLVPEPGAWGAAMAALSTLLGLRARSERRARR